MPERPLYLATAGPEMPLSVIRLEDASDYLPCFDEADLLLWYPWPAHPDELLPGADHGYRGGNLPGRSHDFFRIDHIGNTVSLQVADLYQLAEFLEEHSVILMQGVESFVAIQLD